MRYPVRCCCEPTKLYGHIELPGPARRSGDAFVVERAERLPRPRSIREILDGQPSMMPGLRRHRMELKRVVGPGLDEIAVFSDDRPIEFWRNIVGFEELVPADRFELPTNAV